MEVMCKERRNNNNFHNNASVFDRMPSFPNVREGESNIEEGMREVVGN